MLTEKNIENRKKGIGASEASIVMGLNDNISPYQLWMIKTGRAQPDDLSEIPIVYWGSLHEEPIAQHYAKVMNCKVRRVTNTLFHKEHSFMLCHLDRKIEGLSKVLECKFAMFARDQWGESGSDVVPMAYIVQVQHQLAVTGYEEADLAVLIGGYDFRVYHFKRDEELIARIIADVSEFWKCVETDTPPPLRDMKDAKLAYPFNQGNLIPAEEDIVKAVVEYNNVLDKENELKKIKSSLKDKLTLFIKNADGIRTEKEVLATWKARKDGVRVLNVMEARA
jgi:putative phage-type endonuclease